MSVDGGVGSYKLDFGGTPRQNGAVRIGAGVVSVEISSPPSTAVVVTNSHVLGAPKVTEGFILRDDGYWTPAAVEGQTPLFRVHSAVAVGSLHLQATQPELV
jgi:hypothetical protein